jgi:hypothetical protein
MVSGNAYGRCNRVALSVQDTKQTIRIGAVSPAVTPLHPRVQDFGQVSRGLVSRSWGTGDVSDQRNRG